MPDLQTSHGEYLWKYVPNLGLAISFTVVFLILTAAHIYKMIHARVWFCLPFVIGGLYEVAGYHIRAVSYTNTGSLPLFHIQSLTLFLAPVFFAATIYMVFSRVLRALPSAQEHSPISPRWCTRIFVIADLICLNIQSTGGGLLAEPENMKIGNGIIIGDLMSQIGVFIRFVRCCSIFHRRFAAHIRKSGAVNTVGIPWESMMIMLYGTSALISARNVFRLVEYIMGKDGYLLRYGWPVYTFDGALMLVVMVMFLFWDPNKLQPHERLEIVSDW